MSGSSTAHQDIQELLGAHALDALEREEAEVVERHLEVCPRCRAEVQEHREVAGLLGYAGQDAPAGLWDRISAGMQEAPPALRLERVPLPEGASFSMLPGAGAYAPAFQDPSVFPGQPGSSGLSVVGSSASSDSSGSSASRSGSPESRSGSSAAPGRRSGRRRFASVRVQTVAAMTAAAAVVVGVLGLQVVRLDDRTSRLQTAVTASGAEGPSMAVVDAALSTPGVRRVELAPMSSGESLQAVVLPGGQGYLYDAHLTPLPAAMTYQLWGIDGSSSVSYGLIGNAPVRVVSFRAGPGLKALAVTAEVAGGVTQTVHTPVAAGGVVPPL